MKNLATHQFQMFIPNDFLIYLSYLKKTSNRKNLKIYSDEKSMLTNIFQKIFLNIWNDNKKGFKVAQYQNFNDNNVIIESSKTHIPSQEEISNNTFRYVGPIPNSEFKLQFEYNNQKLIVTIISTTLRNPKNDNTNYLTDFIKSLNKSKKTFEKTYSATNQRLFQNIFDAYFSLGLSKLNGSDAKTVKTLYPNIIEHYPEFKKASLKEQFKVLEYAIPILRGIFSRRDVHSWAQAIFMALYDNNMANTLLIYEHSYSKILVFNKKKEYYHNNVLPYNNQIEFWRNNSIKFITYSTQAFKTCFSPFDLGNIILTRLKSSSYNYDYDSDYNYDNG